MATTRLLSYTDYAALYSAAPSGDAAEQTRVEQRLDDVSAAVMGYLGWPLNAAGDLTMASTTHTRTLPDAYPLRDARRLSLPLWPVTAVSDVRSGEDVGGTAGTDYSALTAGTDYRLDVSDARAPALVWRGGEPDGPDLRVTMTAGWAVIPDDLAGAVGSLVAWSLAMDRRRGLASVASGDLMTTSYRPEEWPADVRAVLAVYLQPGRRALAGA